MDRRASTAPAVPLVSVVIPVIVFYALTRLARPPWIGIDCDNTGYFILAVAHTLPMLILAAPARPRGPGLFGALALGAMAAVFLSLHAGLSQHVVFDLDAGGAPGRETTRAVVSIFVATLVVPIGLAVTQVKPGKRLAYYTLLPALTAILGQVLLFLGMRAFEGSTGMDLWMESQMAIHCAFGLVSGLFFGAATLYRPAAWSTLAGFTRTPRVKLPKAVVLAVLLAFSTLGVGFLRVAVETEDRARFVDSRLDAYFLALSNLRRAQLENLAYPALTTDLRRAARALQGSVSYDGELYALVPRLTDAIEDSDSTIDTKAFQDVTMALNRRLLDLGEPYFLEPQVLVTEPLPFRYLFRYRVAGKARYRIEKGGTVPILRIRRIDEAPVDTAFTGLSYPSIGTVLMDHIDEVSLKSHGILFLPGVGEKIPSDGRFAETRRLMRLDRIVAIEAALGTKGLGDNRGALKELGTVGTRWAQVVDISGARTDMSPATQAIYDALTELLARQIEVHEARHVFDGGKVRSLSELDALDAGNLAGSATSEIRAYLTEMIDGPMGPKFALTTTAGLVAGTGARGNAYFFAGIVMLETLWGEPVRREDIIERPGEHGPVVRVAPISDEHPGWLSYSRIHGAYADLRGLSDEELRERAIEAWEMLFDEEYLSITKQR